jgi:hypothetical protein
MWHGRCLVATCGKPALVNRQWGRLGRWGTTNSPSCSTINSNDEQRQCRRSSCACHVALSDVASSSSFCVVDVAGATSVGDVALPRRSWCGGCGRRKWMGAGGGWCDDDVVVAMR